MQFRITMMLWCALSLLVMTPANTEASANDRVLLVISGNGLDDGKTRPGFEMDELSQAYFVFTDNGLQVDIASPSGGTAVAATALLRRTGATVEHAAFVIDLFDLGGADKLRAMDVAVYKVIDFEGH